MKGDGRDPSRVGRATGVGRRSADELSERDLLDALRRGDRQAFAAVIDRCGDAVYHVAYRLLGSREEAETSSRRPSCKPSGTSAASGGRPNCAPGSTGSPTTSP